MRRSSYRQSVHLVAGSLRSCFIVSGLLLGASFGQSLDYRTPPLDNPLKGFVPYSLHAAANRFPHSLEFSYFALKDVLVGQSTGDEFLFDWTSIEEFLNAAKSRGNQGIFRLHCEYPSKTPPLNTQMAADIPQFLIDRGVAVKRLGSTHKRNSDGKPTWSTLHPNYSSPLLRRALRKTIAALGAKYDGDPRVAYIELGLLGFWGEWHNYPNSTSMASSNVQAEVLQAFEQAFSDTMLLARYPRGRDVLHAPTFNRAVGYHDDSFTWRTLPSRPWHFLALMESAGANGKWKTHPIGGELYPEVNEFVFESDYKNNGNVASDFKLTVERTHASYMRLDAVFRETVSSLRMERAKSAARRMGYDLHFNVANIVQEGSDFSVAAVLENRGVAPFYYNWPVTVGLISARGKIIQEWRVDWRVDGLLPDHQRTFNTTLTPTSTPPPNAKFAVRVPNPMQGGRSLRFSNVTQGLDGLNWMVLGNAVADHKVDKCGH